MREGVIGGAHHRLSSFIIALIVRRRAPAASSDGQRRSVTIIDQLRQMVTGYARQRPPWPSSSALIDKVHRSSSLIRATTISRPSAAMQQAPLSITSNAPVLSSNIGRSSFDGGHHGAHPSRRRCCAVTTAACAELLCRVLFPALREAGAGKQNAVVVIVVRRYARLVVVAGLGLLSFLCSYFDGRLFFAIIDRNGHMLLPLKNRHYVIFIGLKSSNLFW